MSKKILVMIVLNFFCGLPHAEVILDGSLGEKGALKGPDYHIPAEWGQQLGNHLFQSFSEFNLDYDESARFTGPESITHLLARVTGGHPSRINGLLQSDLPHADVYFLNPAGIVFGPHARLDVPGSFYASTAHFLRLRTGGRFDARHPADSLLTIAPIEAFGFFDKNIAPIIVEGQGEINQPEELDSAGLRVHEGQTLSFIGGNLEIRQGTFYRSTEGLQIGKSLFAPYGHIHLFSVAEAGELIVTEMGSINLASFKQWGEIKLLDHALIDVSGPGAGNMVIRGETLWMENSMLQAITQGSQAGGLLDIQASDISLTQGATLGAYTEGKGQASDIYLHALHRIHVVGKNLEEQQSAIYSRSGVDGEVMGEDLGHVGQVTLEAQDILFGEHAYASISTYGGGQGGNLTLRATESVSFSGETEPSYLLARTYSESDFAGDAGQVVIEANNIFFKEGAYLSASTFGSGKGGSVFLKASQDVNFSSEGGTGSGVFLQTSHFGDQAGPGGHLFIEANNISFTRGGYASVATFGKGNAGNITLHAREKVTLSGTDQEGFGSALLSNTEPGSTGGRGGDIIIEAKEVSMTDGGAMITDTYAPGQGGNITITVQGSLTLSGVNQKGAASTISASSGVEMGQSGDAGNIVIKAGHLVLKEGAQITSSSTASQEVESGQAGTIRLHISGETVLFGVNPHGENQDGLGSGIYARSYGPQAGDAGQIILETGSLLITQGAMIETSTQNTSKGGDIEIQVHGDVEISGDSSQIPLKEPAESQANFQQSVFPTHRYNQSTSGIYAHSANIIAGRSGHITLKAETLKITQGNISTSSDGTGQAGDIDLEVKHLILEDHASITSESKLSNTHEVMDLAHRDEQFLVQGEVIEVSNVGENKMGRYVNVGDELVRIGSLYRVDHKEDLETLTQHYSILEGDIVEVTGENSAQYLYTRDISYDLFQWVKMEDHPTVTLQNMEELSQLHNFWYASHQKTLYSSGTMIEVLDAGHGKPATFIYASLSNSHDEDTLTRVIRVHQFRLEEMNRLETFAQRYEVKKGDVAQVNEQHFVYNGQQWVKFGQVRVVDNILEQHRLMLAQFGDIVHVRNVNGQAMDFIYTGQSWIRLHRVHQVMTLPERDQLAVETGDLVKVRDGGEGASKNYLYLNGEWITQIQGGQSGTLNIRAQENFSLSDRSVISTESTSSGGGEITLSTNNLLYLHKSQITTSVQQGSGHGGNVTINSPYLAVLNQGQIRAQAYEGQGGNIHLHAQNFVKSFESLVSASSELGIHGKVVTSIANENLSEGLGNLPDKSLRADRLLKKLCSAINLEDIEHSNHFIVPPIAGSSQSLEDWRPSLFFPNLLHQKTARSQSHRSSQEQWFLTKCKHLGE